MFKYLFVQGLVSFLICHLFYISLYITETKEKEVRKRLTLRQEILITIPYFVFAIAILGFLYPHLGEMKVPVVSYAVIIIIMGRLTWLRYSKTTSMSFKMVMIGAILFVISDFSIAIDRFVYKAKINYLIIGVSYLAAQYLIIHGIIEGNKKGKTKRD